MEIKWWYNNRSGYTLYSSCSGVKGFIQQSTNEISYTRGKTWCTFNVEAYSKGIANIISYLHQYSERENHLVTTFYSLYLLTFFKANDWKLCYTQFIDVWNFLIFNYLACPLYNICDNSLEHWPKFATLPCVYYLLAVHSGCLKN